MQKRIFFVTNVYKAGVQAWDNLSDFSQVNISYCKLLVALFMMQLNERTILKHRNLNTFASRVYDQFFVQNYRMCTQLCLKHNAQKVSKLQ